MNYRSRHGAEISSLNLLRLLSVILLLNFFVAVAHAEKVRVSDPTVAVQLQARGAKLLADYGSFQLFETTGAPAPGLLKNIPSESAVESDFIELNSGPIDTRTAAAKALRLNLTPFVGKRLHLVQFVGPIKPEWHAELEATGVNIVHYVPQNAYLVRGDFTTFSKLQSWAQNSAYVQWEGEFATDYKIHPRTRAITANQIAPTDDWFAIQLVRDPEANAATLALIAQLQLEPIRQQYELLNYLNLVVRIPADKITELAVQPDVISIRPYLKPKRRDERQGQIMAGNLIGNAPSGPGYLEWLAGKGFTQEQFDGSGFVVDISDSGVDNGSTNVNHFGLHRFGTPGLGTRVVYSRLEGSPNPGSTIQGCDGHGNINAHIIGGFNDLATWPHVDAAGYHFGLGICPFVKIGASVIFDADDFTNPSYPNLAARAYRDGARVSNNSWGADTDGDYDSDAQAYDALVRDAQPSGSAVSTPGNQEMIFCFAAGNAGSGIGTVGSPGTAKNVITVGASENVHSHSTANGGNSSSGNDGCVTPDSEANSAYDIATFSSRGPCDDGRQKPDLVAPGTHITGGAPQSLLTTMGTGSAISCFDGVGVCGLPGSGTIGSANNFFPLGQQFYTTSSGTSHSTPAVAAACALLRQYFLNASLPPPSAAMTKAFLVNSARYMIGASANDTLPSPHQGMGAVNLGTAFDGVARVLRDQRSVDKFTASGQFRTIQGRIVDSEKPFRVTLAWTDAPGSTTGNAYNNNLDLTVTVAGQTYKGNVFSGDVSIPGGNADFRNNLESVFIPAGASGSFSVTVTAVNINSDGVPNEAPALDQDYALVIYNAEETTGPAVFGDGYAILSESCAAPNNAVDPGETVTIDFTLRNLGNADTTNLVATLLSTGGVVSPGAPQSYGIIVAEGGTETRSFSFTTSGTCGENVVATFELTDGEANYGQITFTLPLGQFATVHSENFDNVSTPGLPAGWATSASGGQSAWITATTASDTSPNAAYSATATTTGVNELVSPSYTLFPGPSQLIFRHRYILESGYDGGVLEIKIGNGSFTDILTAGGSFVSGGYNTSLASGNALGNRSAWSGTNSSFSPVIVNLPAAAAGQNVQFRWRCGTDSSVSRPGWWIDSIAINSMVCCGSGFAPLITTQPQNQTIVFDNPASFSVEAIGDAPLDYQWFHNNTPLADATNSTYSISSATALDAGNYFVVVTNASGSVTSSVAALNVVIAPVILTNPASLTVVTGSPAAFSVTAIGAAPLSYQWRVGSSDIADATNETFVIANAQLSDAGEYSVFVSNFAGAVTSAPALLAVTEEIAADVVISQIYGGGGNSGATYRNDYVELFNRGTQPANVSGWSVQYASASGSTWQVGNLSGTIPGSGYYLVQLASGGAIGAPLPIANVTDSINISGANGKLALVNNQVALSGSNPIGNSAIQDFVGYGTANAFDGSGAAPAGGNAVAIFRKNGGNTDTDDNSADFITDTPNPRSTVVTNPPISTIDLAIFKSHNDSFAQGDADRTYTIVVTNVGLLATTGTVNVVDVLPIGLTATAMDGDGWEISFETLTATRADALPPNAAYPALTLTVSVAPDAPASVTNFASVSTGGDTNTLNNTVADLTFITATNTGGGDGFTGVLAGWDVSTQSAYGTSPLSPTTNAPHLNIVGLTRGAGVTTTPTAASRAWGGNGFTATSDTEAIAAADFASVSIAAMSGYRISFSAISQFDYRRSGGGPPNGLLQYQIGNGAFVTITDLSYPSSASSGAPLPPIDLSGIAELQNVEPETVVTFRIVNYGASSATGTWYIFDVANNTAPDFAISGSITPVNGVPALPPTLSLLTLVSNQIQFTLSGIPTSNYIVEMTTNLIAPQWTPIHTGAAPFLFSEPATNSQRFYRGTTP